jgi:hypothetical protein
MMAGERVRIYPHGYPDLITGATILTYDPDVPVLVLALPVATPFVRSLSLVNIHPAKGVVMGLYRTRTREGAFIGPWIEIHGGGHYEIEEVPPACDTNPQ